MKGYVYVMSNPSLARGLIKIGQSSQDPEERRRTLSSETGVPEPFVVEYWALVENYEVVERKVHNLLDDFRNSQRREFFTCDVRTAIEAIRDTAEVLLEETSYRGPKEFSQAEVMEELRRNNDAYFNRRADRGQQALKQLRAQLRAAEAREESRAKQSLFGQLLHGKYQPQFTEEEVFLREVLRTKRSDDCYYEISIAGSLEAKKRVLHAQPIFDDVMTNRKPLKKL